MNLKIVNELFLFIHHGYLFLVTSVMDLPFHPNHWTQLQLMGIVMLQFYLVHIVHSIHNIAD